MGTTLISRPARKPPLEVPTAPIMLAAPPTLPDTHNSGMHLTMILMPMMAGTSGLTMALTNQNRPLIAAIGLLMVVVAIGLGAIMFISMRLGPRRKLREERERYQDYLEDMRSTVRKAVRLQQQSNSARHPHPRLLQDIAASAARRWERRAGDVDLLTTRCGLARVPLRRPLSLNVDKANPLTVYDPVCHSAAEELVERYSTLRDQPLTVPIERCGTVSVVGDFGAGRRLLRSMLVQLSTLVSPDDMRLAMVRHDSLAPQWSWLEFMPHVQGDKPGMGELPAPVVCETITELTELLSGELERRRADLRRRRSGPPGPGTQHLVIVVDGEKQVALTGLWDDDVSLSDLGVHVIALVAEQRAEPELVQARLGVSAGNEVTALLLPPEFPADAPMRQAAPADDTEPVVGVSDEVSIAEAAGIATSLSPFRLAETDSGEALHRIHGLAEIIGVADPATMDAERLWKARPESQTLRVPLGVTADGGIVDLDLKESAMGGMGPHGLIIGATGSGKSEALRTLVMALCTRHSPEELALLTVDFKGGATFADCDPLPHNAGSITNLADDLALVDRFREALFGEMLRRQQLLKDVGNLPNAHAYNEMRRTRSGLAPLPHLLVIIDEFSELLTAKPDFSDLFLAVGRIGRSIGVHLLLATQRLESGHIRGLESHLSYRIGLRTFSEAESREAIGVPDAYRLPPEPGSGYLKVDTTIFTRFKAAMVSGPYEPPTSGFEKQLAVTSWPPPSVSALTLASELVAADNGAPSDRSVLQVLVGRMCATDAAAVRPVWLPPLPKALSLDQVDGAADPAEPDRPGKVSAILGLHDKPRQQEQKPLEWDLTGSESNLLVFGGPVTGKSTLIRTLVASLALRYAPGQVACYCIDFGGGSLAPLDELPHVASVASRAQPELMRRILADIQSMLDTRESLMREHGLDSPDRLRIARAAGELPPDVAGDVVLVIDGWNVMRDMDDTMELEDIVAEIAARGPALGVHTVATAVTSMQVRSRMSASFGGRIELRLSDPLDSDIDRRAAEAIPKDIPGRVLLSDEMFGHIALPRIDGQRDTEDLRAALGSLARTVTDRWPQPPVPPVRVLPTTVTLRELTPASVTDDDDLFAMEPIIGVSERDLEPAHVDFNADPHLVMFGDPETGKSMAIRAILQQISRRPSSEVGILLVDPRRSHLDVVPEKHLLSYCTSQAHAAQNAEELAEGLRKRLPGPDVTSQQLRDRSWWNGLDIFVVVDDYELIATGSKSPLVFLAEFVPQGQDIGLHMVISRRMGGAARAVYEPLLQSVMETSPPGLLFSGDRMEGRLSNGVAAKQLPVGRALLTRRSEPADTVQIALS